jgi:hypothetical protein
MSPRPSALVLVFLSSASLWSALLLSPIPACFAADQGAADQGAAEPDQRIVALRAALRGQDSDAKRAAMRVLADPAVGDDDDVLPMLVAAVWDRQAHDDAIATLRKRTGLAPPAFFGQSHYPGYPANDHPESWEQWLREREHDRRIDRALGVPEIGVQ